MRKRYRVATAGPVLRRGSEQASARYSQNSTVATGLSRPTCPELGGSGRHAAVTSEDGMRRECRSRDIHLALDARTESQELPDLARPGSRQWHRLFVLRQARQHQVVALGVLGSCCGVPSAETRHLRGRRLPTSRLGTGRHHYHLRVTPGWRNLAIRVGLRSRWGLNPVWVRVPPRAPLAWFLDPYGVGPCEQRRVQRPEHCARRAALMHTTRRADASDHSARVVQRDAERPRRLLALHRVLDDV